MGRVLLGALFGAAAVTILTVAFIWAAPFIALGVFVWFISRLVRQRGDTRRHFQGHAEPMQRSANPRHFKALPPPKMADSFRRSGNWSRSWK